MSKYILAEKLVEMYLSRFTKSRPFIVAIDGLSGSGKTTLAKELEQELIKRHVKVTTIHMDDYIVARSKRYNTGYPEWHEYYNLQWDIADLTESLFKPLHDREKNKVPEAIRLIEGIFLQRKEWNNFYDFVLFVDCPRELRYERTLRRSVNPGSNEERKALYNCRYWPGEDHYLSTEQPMEKADLIWNTALSKSSLIKKFKGDATKAKK